MRSTRNFVKEVLKSMENFDSKQKQEELGIVQESWIKKRIGYTYTSEWRPLPKGFNLESKNPEKVYSSILGKYINPKTGEVIEEENV